MSEPETKEIKDFDGYTWVRTSTGWSLKNHDQVCYQDLSWRQVEKEYGPMRFIES
jgi:hypothetical protein